MFPFLLIYTSVRSSGQGSAASLLFDGFRRFSHFPALFSHFRRVFCAFWRVFGDFRAFFRVFYAPRPFFAALFPFFSSFWLEEDTVAAGRDGCGEAGTVAAGRDGADKLALLKGGERIRRCAREE